jgi:hypothetical protein
VEASGSPCSFLLLGHSASSSEGKVHRLLLRMDISRKRYSSTFFFFRVIHLFSQSSISASCVEQTCSKNLKYTFETKRELENLESKMVKKKKKKG